MLGRADDHEKTFSARVVNEPLPWLEHGFEQASPGQLTGLTLRALSAIITVFNLFVSSLTL